MKKEILPHRHQHAKPEDNGRHCLIVDDEFSGRMMIAGLLSSGFPELPFHFATSYDEVQLMVSQHTYDIVFLDINLPGKNGLEIAVELSKLESGPLVVLVSAHERFEWSREALRLGLFDYLIKPIGSEEFAELIARLLDRITARQSGKPAPTYTTTPTEQKISLRVINGLLSIKISDIVCFEADGSYSVLTIYEDQKTITIFEPLCDIEQKTTNWGLIRLGRRHIINPTLVERLNNKDHSCMLRTQTGYKVIGLSQTAYNQLKEMVKYE